jgi:hypothetical protein
MQEWTTKRVAKGHPHMVTREPKKLPKNDPSSLELQRMSGLLHNDTTGVITSPVSDSQVSLHPVG